MAFLVSFLLLLSGGKEEETFWVYTFLMVSPNFLIMGFFEDSFPFVHFLLFLYDHLAQKEIKKIHAHLNHIEFKDILWLFKWFITLFIHFLPISMVIRFWDLMIL